MERSKNILTTVFLCMTLWQSIPVFSQETPFLWTLITAPPSFEELNPSLLLSNSNISESFLLSDILEIPTLEGESILVPINENEIILMTLRHFEISSNEDKNWRFESVEDAFYSLTITAGKNTLFGELHIDNQHTGIVAEKLIHLDKSSFSGHLFQINDFITTEGQTNDFEQGELNFLPNKNNKKSLLNFKNTATKPIKRIAAASNSNINKDNLDIDLSTNKDSYNIGDNIEITIQLGNTSDEALTNIQATFEANSQSMLNNLNDDSEKFYILSTPEECELKISSNTEKLYLCEISNLEPNEKISYSFSLITNLNITIGDSDILEEINLSLFLDNDYSITKNIPLSIDLISDSNNDGTSDFNEEFLVANNIPKSDENTIIDLLVLYSKELIPYSGQDPETFVNFMISKANKVFADSNLSIEIRPVAIKYVDYLSTFNMDTALNNLYAETDGLEGTRRLRARYGADLVTFLGGQISEGEIYCGTGYLPDIYKGAYILPSRESSFMTAMYSAFQCSSVLAHELGHNFGLLHSRKQNGEGEILPFALGYGVDNAFTTIMAYPNSFNNLNRKHLFSSPNIKCDAFNPCGISHDVDPEKSADAVTVLDAVRFQVASYFSTRPETGMKSINKKAVTSKIEGGFIGLLYGDDKEQYFGYPGFSYNNYFNGKYGKYDIVDVAFTFKFDELHLGKKGQIFSVVQIPGIGFFQLNEDYQFVPWNGRLSDLYSFSGTVKLEQNMEFLLNEELTIIDFLGVDDKALKNIPADSKIRLYLAYSYDNQSDFIYTAKPISFILE